MQIKKQQLELDKEQWIGSKLGKEHVIAVYCYSAHLTYTQSVCVCVRVTPSCLTLCDPMDSSPPGSSAHGILQARILEWVAIPFFRGSSWPRDQTCISCIAGRFFTIWATREAWYAEYIMWNAGLSQARITVAGRNINNLRYADDTTLMAESEEELKSLLMRVKEKWKSWLETQHSKN